MNKTLTFIGSLCFALYAVHASAQTAMGHNAMGGMHHPASAAAGMMHNGEPMTMKKPMMDKEKIMKKDEMMKKDAMNKGDAMGASPMGHSSPMGNGSQ